jgi:DNA-binding transcriptional LysR family regulator
MDAVDLRYFRAVAQAGGIGRAARALHTVQSNVTARIRRLEDELGSSLFDRHSRGVRLTEAGQRLLPYADRADRLFEEARRAVDEGAESSGPLVIGALETTAALRLTPILLAFGRAHPRVDLSIQTGTSEALTDALLERRIEGAFVAGPLRHPALVEDPVVTEELVLVTAPGVDAGEILGGPFKVLVFRQGCSYRRRFERLLATRRAGPHRTIELGTLDGILGCVSAGLGVSYLPRAICEAWARRRAIALHPFGGAAARVTTVFARRRDGTATRALASFVETVRASRR